MSRYNITNYVGQLIDSIIRTVLTIRVFLITIILGVVFFVKKNQCLTRHSVGHTGYKDDERERDFYQKYKKKKKKRLRSIQIFDGHKLFRTRTYYIHTVFVQ